MSLLRATLTLLAGGALAQALPLLLGPWITRLYTPNEFGVFSLVWVMATNLSVAACARYEFALPMAQDEDEAARLMALCLRALAMVAALSLLVALALGMWQQLPLAGLLPLAVVSGAAAQWLTMWATRAHAYQRLAWARVLQWGGAAVLQVLLGLLAWGAWGLLVAPVIAGLAAAWLLAAPAPQGGWRALLGRPWRELRAVALRHRDFPLFNTPHAFAGALQDSLAILLISAWTGDAAAGYWALTLRYLKAPAGLVGGALSQTLYPRMVQAESGPEALQLIRQALLALTALALPLVVVLMLWGPWLFATVFGERWHDAGALARALAPYIGLHFIASPLSVATMAWRAQAWALRLALVGQVLYVLGLAVGLFYGGLIGAAWGVSAAMLGYFGYFFWKLATWQKFPPTLKRGEA